MSISRLLHEFRPLFRMLEEPITRTPTIYGFPPRPFFADPFLTSSSSVHPALDLTEEGNSYVVEAELPGVKKENVDITVGDEGRSVTIRGKAVSRRVPSSEAGASQGEGSEAVVSSETSSNQLTAERLYSGASSFTRTVWLPHPVDSSKITASLVDGVLTLKAPRMEDKEGVKINIE